MTPQEQRRAAKEFANRWENRGRERAECQSFWIDLLEHVFGVDDYTNYISFEEQAHIDTTSFIDAYIAPSKVLIEQKSADRDLHSKIKQSDGSLLDPFQQAKRYVTGLPYHMHPRWIITCNFKSFLVYDMDLPNSEPQEILLKNLAREYNRLSFIVESESDHIQEEYATSLEAGEIIGEIYDAILSQYNDAANPSPATLKSLNMFCVRIVFCLYAEDAGLFGRRNMFGDYIRKFEAYLLRRALLDLFKVLDTKEEERDPYLEEDLAAFPYVNGGLFTEEDQTIPQLSESIKQLLLQRASGDFNWSEISPAIFGSIFESTLNPDTRRDGGMHYTSIVNIHKVIDPLFLDDLRDELNSIKQMSVIKRRDEKLLEFQKKLGSLKFFDPACGSGNFLTETYICLRKMENECIGMRLGSNRFLDVFTQDEQFIFVDIHQFYGIEINDFAVSVAKTALWIAESQMMNETNEVLSSNLEFLPLKSYANIIEGNALSIDWETVVPKSELSYIIGNPPFIGARMKNSSQKDDIRSIFPNERRAGNIDYVGCWFIKAKDMMKGTKIQTALVATNSITQGEQPYLILKPLIDDGIHINFAYRTFRWDSEALLKAHVHCVIIGFSFVEWSSKKIYPNALQTIKANNINGYLLDEQNIFVKYREQPICNVSPINMGSMPNDGRNLLLNENEYKEFIRQERNSSQYIKEFVGAEEFINNKKRYCLWLKDANPEELNRMPLVKKRVEAVKSVREASNREATRKLANTPYLFGEIRQPVEGNYILIPRISSEKRKYIPIGFLDHETIASDATLIIPNATMYEFGVLTSIVHNVWVRYVCGRLEMRYRYSAEIVYNNFPWPDSTDEQKKKIEETAKKVLDARANHPAASLATLYGVFMPQDLFEAHQENDKAVMRVYGFSSNLTESEIASKLFKRYEDLITKCD